MRPSVLAAACWALVAVAVVRRRTRRTGVRALAPRSPRLPASGAPGVQAVLDRLSPTCLERALVLQSWLAGQGRAHDIVVGVPVAGMSAQPAHAWLSGIDTVGAGQYREIHRLSAPAVRR